MNVKKLLVAALGVGVVANIWDYVVHVMVLQGPYYSQMPGLFRQDTPVAWMIVGDFVAAVVFVWVYARVHGSFGGGPKGGATYGLYAGILVNFPMGIFFNLIFVGFPYSLSWIWMIAGVIYGVIMGAVAGALYKK